MGDLTTKRNPAASARESALSGTGRVWLISVLLVALVVAAYWQAGKWGFVNLDDDAYVEFQPMVNQGLRPAAFVWAWTASHSNNWHPLTSLSHMLDCSLFGVAPGPMHWVNVGWHMLNTLLVFLVWQAATGATWRSAAVAGLFALHPSHVESVAWISERKDVLSTFFWLLALRAYVRHARAPSAGRYAQVAVFLVLGLLCKPMVVTLPFTLLLLDFWPLRRWPGLGWRRLIVEKVPFFIIALLHSAITLAVQVSTGASHYGERLSLSARLGNAVVSVIRYVGKGVWPDSLSPHYDHPGWWPWWAVAGSLLAIAVITTLVWWQRNKRPWLMFGWAWFLLTLLPVIGIVQVGAQAMADRYTYVPFLGLFTSVVWALGGMARHSPGIRIALASSMIVLLGLCALHTHRQASAWKDSVTLYERSIAAGVDNATIRYLHAVALRAAGHPDEAVAAGFRRAIEFTPTYANAYTQLALLALGRQDFAEAERLVAETIRMEPRNPGLRKNLAMLRNMQGRPAEAAAQFGETLKLDPNDADAHRELAWMYLNDGRFAEALLEFEAVVRVSRWDFAAHGELGAMYLRLGRLDEARGCFERALWIHPKYGDAELNLRQLKGGGP